MTEKQPYIILSDADFDDLIAIAWLSICPEADIKLISCSQDGWSHSPQGAENIARVLQLDPAAATIPIAIGEPRYSNDNMVIPEELRNLVDKLWEINIDRSSDIALLANAPQMIIDTINNSPEPVTIIALAPITDLALALEQDSSIGDNIKKLTIMGGEPYIQDSTDNFPGNIHLDIKAAPIVYNQYFPIQSIGKVVNHNFPLKNEKFNLLHHSPSPMMRFIFDLVVAMRKRVHHTHKRLCLWDVLAAFVALFDRQYSLIESIDIALDIKAQDFRQAIQYQSSGHEIEHIVDINPEAFDELFFQRLINYQGGDCVAS